MKRKMGKIAAVFLALCCLCSALPAAAVEETTVFNYVNAMPLEEKIAQMLVVDIRSWYAQDGTNGDFTVMNQEVADIIADNALGGVILFAENLQQTEQAVKLTDGLQKAARSKGLKISLLIGTDQEGGEIVRLNSGTSLPGNMALGANKSQRDSYRAGEILAKELLALGINADYAPSLDVNNNPLNPVIGLRSFSSDPKLAGQLGVKVIEALQTNHVSAAVKHFPGHGNTVTDSHYGLPTVDKSLQQLKETELVPFQEAIKQGVDMVMTAHIQFPQIEKNTVTSELTGEKINLPATLSKTILTDLLRKEMGFEGVITTDAMNMEAISQNFGVSQACILAINAGVDMLLMPVSLTSSADAQVLKGLIGDIKQAVEAGTISEKTIDNAVTRILTLKEKRGILRYKKTEVQKKVDLAKNIVGSEEHHQIENEIACRAVTLVNNENNVLPFKAKEGEKVVLVAAYSNEVPAMEYALTKMMAEGKLPKMEYKSLYYQWGSSITAILEEISNADYVITLSEMNEIGDLSPDSLSTYVPKLIENYTKEKQIKSVLVSVSKPYDLANFSSSPALMAVYGANGMNAEDADGTVSPKSTYGPNIPAAVEVAFGVSAPWGTLPVDIPTITDTGEMDTNTLAYPIGHGLTYAGYTDPYTEPATQADTSQEATNINKEIANEKKLTLTELVKTNRLWIVLGAVVLIVLVVVLIKTRKKKEKKNYRYK